LLMVFDCIESLNIPKIKIINKTDTSAVVNGDAALNQLGCIVILLRRVLE